MRIALVVALAALAALLLAPMDALAEDSVDKAVSPLPAPLRAGAAVIEWDAKTFAYKTVRKGTNSLVCFRVPPSEAKLDARCYHKDFIPAIARSLVLELGGVKGHDLDQKLIEEVKAGKLVLPKTPTMGYRNLDGEVWESVHIPFATAEQLGAVDMGELSREEQKKVPYAMAAGSWWAHVMIEHAAAF
jgi:hypothetical protein